MMKHLDIFISTLLAKHAIGAGLNQRDAPPSTSAPIDLQPQFFTELGAERVQFKYGPFLVPSVDDMPSMGMQDFVMQTIPAPCGDCIVTVLQPNLEFDNGTTADADNGLWLHHLVLFNTDRNDTTCATYPQRFAASGNERTTIDLTHNGTTKAGYYIKDGDNIAMLVELMNQYSDVRNATVTLEWEYIPGIPTDFMVVDPVWLDVTGGCGDSDEPVPANTPVFNFSLSPAWSPSNTGEALFVAGHLHDGGVNIELYENGKVVCDSYAKYDADSHVSSIAPICYNLGSIGPADNFTITAYYNLTAHAGMMDAMGMGEMPVMGIMLMYVGETPSEMMPDV